MKKKLPRVLLLSLIITISFCAYAETEHIANDKSSTLTTVHKCIYDLKQLVTAWRFSFESVKMPDANERNMGLLGINYLVDINSWVYAGLGGYTAVSGKRGGLFALGVEAGIHHKLFGNLVGDAGFYAGGGGGGSSLVGSGLMLRPHVGVSYDFKNFLLGVELSHVRFQNGSIKSTQASITLTIPGVFAYSSPENSGKTIFDSSAFAEKIVDYINFSENYISLLEQSYFQTHSSKDNFGNVDTSTMSTVGAEVDHFFNPKYFTFFKGAGAFAGHHNGYMDVLGGLGYRLKFAFLPRLSLKARFGFGAGGGGNVDTGGGVLLEPGIGVEYQLTPKISAEVDSGYLFAPDGKFKALDVALRLNYRLFFGELADVATVSTVDTLPWEFKEWRVRVVNQTYFNPQRINGVAQETVNLVGVKFDTFFNPYLYITGQANSAYAGKNVGGYASGLLGLGLRSEKFLDNKIEWNAEVLTGAGGGGSMNVGGGLLLHPVVGLTYYFNPYVGLQAEVGRILGLKGKLNATTLDFGLVFDFVTLQH